MTILGIWDGHDAGAACLIDGRLVSAVNEERLTRRKLDVAFPSRSIETCLAEAGRSPADVSIVAASTTDPAKALGRALPWTKERYYQVRRRQARPGPWAAATRGLKRRITEWKPNPISRAVSRAALRRQLSALGLSHADLRLYDHHECHAIAAAHASGFDRCTVVTIDGLGDGVSASVSRFAGGRLERLAESPARDSLGVFFELVTQLLNMRELEDEGKVMALADYAADAGDRANPMDAFFRVDRGRVHAAMPARRMHGALGRILWSTPNEQFARLAQSAVERVCLDLVRSAIGLTNCPRVALAGGLVSNIKVNRLIRLLPDVEDVYVFPHMGDGGLAAGAAVAACVEAGVPPAINLDSLALGPAFDDGYVAAALERAGLRACRPADLAREVADLLERGRVVCWFQGAMEYGPRALGQRSILARPDDPALRDRLNLVLKRRVWYQPFCPSVLDADAAELFADWTPSGRRNHAMTMAYMTTPEGRRALAGVVNVDGSCRPHLVPAAAPGPYADLLRDMRRRIGVGAVLNTSFNIHGEPLVCDPGQAIDVFQRGGADALAIGSFLVRREAR